jgi:DNA-binding MarR family transcriptional regulator
MSEKRDPLGFAACVCFNLRTVTRTVTRFYDAAMRRHGTRPTQGTILAILQMQDSWTMGDLCEILGMERTTLVRNLKPLQRDGFVQIDGGGHGNRVELALTAKGKKRVEQFAPAWRSAQDAVIATLGETRWSAILSDLGKAAAALKA